MTYPKEQPKQALEQPAEEEEFNNNFLSHFSKPHEETEVIEPIHRGNEEAVSLFELPA